MQLLKEIIDLCSGTQGSLTDALLKTKVLLHQLGHKELVEWVNDELNGYANSQPVPDYRVIPVRLFGTVSNMAYRYANAQLPTFHLTAEQRKRFTIAELRQSVSVLEEYLSGDGSLTSPIPPEWHRTLAKGAITSGYEIEKAWTQFEITQVKQVVTEVRSRLLDFSLNLKGELGDIHDDKIKDAAKDIDTPKMFANSIHGDNHTFIVGSRNVTTITNRVTKGDVNALLDAFRNAGVTDADLLELKGSVEGDDAAAVAATKQFGPRVKGWMTKMTAKAIDGAWAIGIGAGGNLLADALGSYYGTK